MMAWRDTLGVLFLFVFFGGLAWLAVMFVRDWLAEKREQHDHDVDHVYDQDLEVEEPIAPVLPFHPRRRR